MRPAVALFLVHFIGFAEPAIFSWLFGDKPETKAMTLTCSSTKIVGGTVSKRGIWPFMALLALDADPPFCGGSILNEKWILTAAHCVYDLEAADIAALFVTVGDYDVSKKEGSEQRFAVDKVFYHESYDSDTVKNDIALVKIKGSIAYTAYAKAICLPVLTTNFTGQTCTVIGWGRTSEGGDVSKVPMQVSIPVLSLDQCRKKFPQDRINSNTQLCGGLAGKGKDSCQGDSGGPFVCADKGTNYVVGVVSYGYGCTEGGVYTKVSGFDKWIRDKIAKN